MSEIKLIRPADTEPYLKPYAVPIKTAQKLLGDKARSEIYPLIAKGELEAIKDGAKTLIVLASIERRQASLPRGIHKEPVRLQTSAARKKRLRKQRARKGAEAA
jgi:hypothetical protein